MKKLFRYFLQGLVYTLPLVLTIYVIYIIIKNLNSILGFGFPGLGLIVLLVGITAIGFLGSSFLFSGAFKYFDKLLNKVPLVKMIYSSIKDLISAFVGDKKKFENPVLVKISKELDIERIGFITKEDLSEIGIGQDKVAVYFPYSYSIMGKVSIIPRKNVTPMNVSSSAMMKFIVSGGITSIHEKDEEV